MDSLNDVRYDIHTEFHMLRHFGNPEPDLIDRLVKAGYADEQIEKEVNLSGSRFFSPFARTIKELLIRCDSYPFDFRKGLNENLVYIFAVPKTEFKDGIGSLGVKPIEELSDEAKAQIHPVSDRSPEVGFVKVKELPRAWEFSIILQPDDGSILFLSGFPGKPGMPLPDPSMQPFLLNACRSFWRSHVFLRQAL